jgi:hypothetical protein
MLLLSEVNIDVDLDFIQIVVKQPPLSEAWVLLDSQPPKAHFTASHGSNLSVRHS